MGIKIILITIMITTVVNANNFKKYDSFLSSIKQEIKTIQMYRINEFFNKFPYKKDKELYGYTEYKATINEFLKNNGGDCEDYAIAKYHTFKSLGYNPNDFIYIYGYFKGVAHLVLAYKYQDDYIIFDNNRYRPVPLSIIKKYNTFMPVYAYNAHTNNLFVYDKKNKEFINRHQTIKLKNKIL